MSRRLSDPDKQEDSGERQAKNQFIGNDLRRRPKTAEQREPVRGCPGAEDDAVDADAADRHHEEGAHVQVGGIEIDVSSEEVNGSSERNDRRGYQRGDEDHQGCEEEDPFIRGAGDQVFLTEQLDPVGHRLQEALGTGAGRSHTILHGREHLALEIGHVRHANQEHVHDQERDQKG